MIQVAFDFTLHQKVSIIEIETTGIVTGLIIEDLGKQYRVCFWHDGVRKSEWLLSEEIREA
jgi:hypothetical protein